MSQGTLIGTGESSEVVLRNDTTVIKKFKKRNFFNDELKVLKMLDKLIEEEEKRPQYRVTKISEVVVPPGEGWF